ncbi:hypothetical protein M9Y10_037834 [Tritrichomonas musculus]|mgnify:FL=1|uniref:KAT8 regulatory NSL complex subunit 2 n=1 Tax=Tritrichomonas musculus TaxID=1915356 RepID=A0ABR2K7B9_9EUKA
MQKDSVQLYLESNGLDSALSEVPSKFETTEKHLESTESSLSFQTQKLCETLGCQPPADGKMNSDTYSNIRRYFVNQARGQSRKEFLDREKKSIQEKLESGNIDTIRLLFKNRHEWRTSIHKFRSDDMPICVVENCPHVALKGSNFCINHIMLDKNQKLYVECPQCHQPHPVFTDCFSCQ